MTEDTSPENLRKFLESDDPALVRMGMAMAKGLGVEVTIKDLDRFLKSEGVETIKTGIMLADEGGYGDEAVAQVVTDCLSIRPALKDGVLEEFGDRAVEILVKALGDKNRSVRRSATWNLSRIAAEPTQYQPLGSYEVLHPVLARRAVEPLIKALRDKDENVRHNSAEALGSIGDTRAVKPLIKAFGHNRSYGKYYRTIARALGEIGDARAVKPLIKALSSIDKDIRENAAEALGKIGDDRAVEPLIKALGDDERLVCSRAAEALGEIGDDRAVEPLIKGGWWRQLGRIGDARAVEPLIKALGNNWWGIVSSATGALGEIGDARAVEPLIEVLLGNTFRERGSMEETRIRVAAAEALGEIGDVRAVEPLLEVLSEIQAQSLTLMDENWNLRECAVGALKKLGHEIEWLPDIIKK